MLSGYDFSPQRRPSRRVVGDVGVLSTPVVLLAAEDVAARPPTASVPTQPAADRTGVAPRRDGLGAAREARAESSARVLAYTCTS